MIANPILDNSFLGGFGNLEFVPASRIAYQISSKWRVAAEEYADIGPLRGFEPTARQAHQLFGVADYSGKTVNIEFGIGFGLTPASDKMTIKLMMSRNLY